MSVWEKSINDSVKAAGNENIKGLNVLIDQAKKQTALLEQILAALQART